VSITGEPCWIQLSTDDVDTAVSFYGDLFGWSAGEPSEEHQGYRMFLRGGEPIAGLVPTADGSRPTWTVFLATPDLRGTVDRAAAAGGSVLIGPTPVAGLGSFAELTDPAGAAIGAWEADAFAGFTTRGEDNAPTWFETLSSRYDDTVAFYQQAFRWETHAMSDTPDFRYTTLGRDENARAGVMDAGALLSAQPARWQFYVQVPDADEAIATAVSVGGELVHAAEDTPYGRIATLMDPAGVRFCVLRRNW
jgi:hypothetical protein